MDLTACTWCEICLKKLYRYTCPRCNIKYCDLECYKHAKHANCSELFYRDCFVNELKNRKVSKVEKNIILEKIKKIEEENPVIDFLEDNMDCELPLAERLQNIDLNDLKEEDLDDLWEKLTPKEQEEFKELVQSGFTSVVKHLSEHWKPWWLDHNPGLITEIHTEKQSSFKDCLPHIISVPPFEKLIGKRTLSPLVGFNLLNVLYPYAFFQRLFNGCGTSEFCFDFCELFVSSSAVLKHNQNFNDADEALCACIKSCVEAARKQEFTVDNQFSIECIHDVSHILLGPDPQSPSVYAACLLSDMHTSLKKFRKFVKGECNKDTAYFCSLENSEQLNKLLFRVTKKLEFFLSWCLADTDQLPLLSMEVSELYKHRLQCLRKDVATQKANVTKEILETSNKTTKQLIVELD